MSIALITRAWTKDVGGTVQSVLIALCDQANDSGVCWPSQDLIAWKLGVSKRTVIRAIKTLEEAGAVTITRRKQQSSLYTITLDALPDKEPFKKCHSVTSQEVTPVSLQDNQEVTQLCPSRSDTGVTQTVKEPPVKSVTDVTDAATSVDDPVVAPPKAERKPTPIYEVVEAWATAIGLDELPGAKTKPWGMAKTAVRDGLLPEEVAPIHAWLSADEWWRKRGIDIATIAGQKGKWQSVGSPGAVRDGAGTWAAHLRHLIDTEPWHYAGSANRERVEAARREWEKRNTP